MRHLTPLGRNTPSLPSPSSHGTFANVAREQEALVLRTRQERDLDQIRFPHVQAVICAPSPPPWLAEVARAVRSGGFVVPRTILENVGIGDVERWLHANLPHGAVATSVRAALLADLVSLVQRQQALTGALRFVYRILTETPSRHCGFHVDTIMPGAPPWGLLRVYNGARTSYVEPSNVTSMREVYRHLHRRERLVREIREAQATGQHGTRRRLLDDLVALDDAPQFLRAPGEVATVPAGSIVAFKHLDIRLHWSDHPSSLAWIHCSPMEGTPRLLANVTVRPGAGASRHRPRSGASAQ
jgi:hypothetical protein